MPRILITGGAGFIGSYIVQAALQAGHMVRVLDNLSTGKLDNLSCFLDQIEFIEGDVRDSATVERAVTGVEAISHQAALISVPGSFTDPLGYLRTNVEGTLQVLEAARLKGVKRIVLASTSAVYGDVTETPISESASTAPQSPYAASKRAGEVYLQLYALSHGMKATALRYFNVFGPRQDPKSEYAAVIPKFLSLMQAGRPPRVFGDGSQTRDFIFVEDVARINLLALFRPGADFQTFNVASGVSHSILDLVHVLNEVLCTCHEPIFEPRRPGDIEYSSARVDHAANALGFHCEVSLHNGLARMAEGPA